MKVADYEELTREEKLVTKQREHRALVEELNELRDRRKPIDNRIKLLGKRIKSVGQAIYDLKHEGNTPEVTDHAVVRYLQRVKGMDIFDLKAEIIGHKQAKQVGNVVVTVLPEELQREGDNDV